ncbi:MAG: LuxR C-terminal-related transcriptional regulator, partial [Chloroflexota bacterium]|nr:LuxR C-terminal-related transcriptional regulator [Chloroflexota bacterium]
EIIDAVRRLCDGESLLSPRETVELFRLVGQQRDRDRRERAALDRLTPREREVLAALADGLNDKEIAQRLGVGNETVRTHMVNVFGKLASIPACRRSSSRSGTAPSPSTNGHRASFCARSPPPLSSVPHARASCRSPR